MRILLLTLILCAISKIGVAQMEPAFFNNSNIDTDKYLVGKGISETKEVALLQALFQIAQDIDSDISSVTDSYTDEDEGSQSRETTNVTSKIAVNQVIGFFSVKGVIEIYTQLGENGALESEKSEMVIRVTYQPDENTMFEVEMYYESTIIDGEEEENSHGSVEWANCSINDVLVALEKVPGLSYKSEERINGSKAIYYTLVTLDKASIKN